MRFQRLALLALASLSLAAARVKLLKDTTFEPALAEEGHLFVMFHAPWCEHCKALKPIFEQASKLAAKEDPSIVFAKVDATKYEDLAKKNGVKGFPALRFFKERESQPIDSDSVERTPEELAAYAVRVARAPDRVLELTAGKSIKEFVSDMQTGSEVGVLGFFEDQEDADLFVSTAEKFKYPVRFAWTTKPYARKYLGLDNDTAVNLAIMFKPFDEKRHEFALNGTREHSTKTKTGMADMMHKMMGVPIDEALNLIPEPQIAKDFKDWVTVHMVPLVVPFMEGYMNLIFTGPIQVHMIIVLDPEADNEEIEDVASAAALARRGEVLHILMPEHESTEEMREFFGVAGRQLPTAVLSDMRNANDDEPQGLQYLWPEDRELTATALINFEQKFFDGELAADGGANLQKKKKKKKRAKAKKSESAEL